MAFGAKRLYQGQMSTTLTSTLATVTALKQWIVKDIEIVNTDTVQHQVTLGMPGSGASHHIFSAVAIEAKSTLQWSGHVVLEAGETITGGADTGSVVTVTISGAEG